ncbi:MAG: hypothetical protein ACLVJH_16630 [Faecalibacterium prausnitzii]
MRPDAFRRLWRIADRPERLAGESAQLKYPMQGDLLSPFVLQDFDGDGSRMRRCCIPPPRPPTSALPFLQQDDSRNVWQVRQTVEGLCRYGGQCQSGSTCRLAVQLPARRGLYGCRRMTTIWPCTPIENGAAVHHPRAGSMSSIWWRISPAAAVEDLILMSTLEDGGVQIELLTVR